MGKGDYLGEFEELVLLAVTRCGEDAYGMEVRRAIADRIGRDVSIGAVYATIERLVAKGLLRTRNRTRHDDQDGRPRRFFEITKQGLAMLHTADRLRHKMRDGLKLKRVR